ncbi:MAG: Gfo/Idh/MocA family oxidoreductase, partial [Dehalococcoidia bacterium]
MVLRVGIIGANPTSGWAARAHLPGLKAGIPGLTLSAVSTTRQESADQAAKEFGAEAAYDDHRKMLAADVIDIGAVVVKLPHHYALAKDVINAGKHVYVEWPLGTDTAQAEELAALAKSKGVRTAVGLQAHHSADYKHMRKLIDDGFVGEVLAVSMTQYQTGAITRPSARLWMKDVEAGGSNHTIAFAHAFDGLQAAVGPIVSLAGVVSAQVHEWTATDTGEKVAVTAPDNTLVSGRLASGAVVSVHVGAVVRPTTGHRVEVHGTEGTLVLEAPSSPHAGAPSKLYGSQGNESETKEIAYPEDKWVTDAGLSGAPANIGKIWKGFAESITSGGDFENDFDAAIVHHKL